MATEPDTCELCGALITDDRGGELTRLPDRDEEVWIHPACLGRYIPKGDARFAYLSLSDPVAADLQGWVKIRDIEAQRGHWRGSDGADFGAGLEELIRRNWVEADNDRSRFRITPQGAVLKGRLGLS